MELSARKALPLTKSVVLSNMDAHTAGMIQTCSISSVAALNNVPLRRNQYVSMFAAYSLLLAVFGRAQGHIRIACVTHNTVNSVAQFFCST